MTAENSARGLASRRAGKRAQHRAVTWLREHGGAPEAEVTTAPHRGDMVTGVGDINLEVTVESWQAIGEKADQAARDARALGYAHWCIWKPRRGVGDMGRAWCITEFRQLWALMRELDQLRRIAAVLVSVVNADSAKMLSEAGISADDILRIIGGPDAT